MRALTLLVSSNAGPRDDRESEGRPSMAISAIRSAIEALDDRVPATTVDAHVRADRVDVRVRSLTEHREGQSGPLRVVGQSPEWRHVLRKATQVARTDTTVFLQGESGTGKEVLARFIQHASPRRRGPFVAINCAALPEQLFESELFGFERGAFTGAEQPKPGQFELAAGGVLFLDEVTEMTAAAQAKFLRVLEEREFLRLGGTRPIRANVRVIAATNRHLDDAVAHGEFRADLYYRLNVFDIRIPPLRERRDDILPLAAGLLQEFAGTTTELTPQAMEALCRHEWPGNVRELRNVLERALILCDGRFIDAEHLCLRARRDVPPSSSKDLGTLEKH